MKQILAVILFYITLVYSQPPEIHGEQDLSLVKFILYTRVNPFGEEVEFEFTELPNNYVSSKRTFFLIHGWNSDIDYADQFTLELLEYDDCNIFAIDWSQLESWTNYFSAAETSIDVGIYVGDFVSRLAILGLDHDNIHVIGHSLGAQAAGQCGRRVVFSTGLKIARITALDPAKPYFDISQSVKKGDAIFVDVIHTNSGELINGCLSFIDPLGDVDFYPAGGQHQPGCTEICTIGCTDSDLVDLMKGGCSHGRANDYFAESINSEVTFVSSMCSSWDDFAYGYCIHNDKANMGLPANSSNTQGTYYLNVHDESPFALGY